MKYFNRRYDINYFNIIIVILFVISVGICYATDDIGNVDDQGFYDTETINESFFNQETGVQGFWNYEEPKVEQPKKEDKNKLPEIIPPNPLPSTAELMKMHPDHIQILIKQWRKHAVHTLSPEDVSEYLRVQDVARKKATAYAAVSGLISQFNPELSLADEVPITNAGREAQYSERADAMNKYLQKASSQFGLLYFSSKTCVYCRIQDGVLKQFLSVFKFDIEVVDFDQSPLMAQRFNIKQTPSIIIIKRSSKKHAPVAFGATSLPALKENIYRAIRYIQQEILPVQFYTNEADIDSGLDPANKQN